MVGAVIKGTECRNNLRAAREVFLLNSCDRLKRNRQAIEFERKSLRNEAVGRLRD